MGGSSGGKKDEPSVEYAAPLDYGAIMSSANSSAAAAAQAQTDALLAAYPQLAEMQLQTIQQIANNLNNQYTAAARSAIDATAGDSASIRGLAGSIATQATDIRDIAGDVRGIGSRMLAQSGPTSIERQLYQQAERDLALGRKLSPEEARSATQSARAAMAARGLATGNAGAAAEILNRDAYASQRESERRNFAGATNQMFTQNIANRLGQAASALGSSAGLYGNAANVLGGASNAYAQSANVDQNRAQLLANLDPYYRALGFSNIGSGVTNALAPMIGNTWNNAQQMAGNVASFNANSLDSRANSQLNNWASMNAAQMQSAASNNAGMMGMFGGLGQGVLGAAGLFALSDKREKTEIKPLGKSGSILGLKTYSYRYKGDDKERIGMMAQDVQKVLPEAVTEVEYKGKKRLAIKPAVIGAALAEELAAQAA